MNYNILIVEDDNNLNNFMENSLVENGYKCTVASSGKDCLAAIKQNLFDLILLDLDLGDMNGSEILKLLRNQSNSIPVIVVSTFNNIDTKVDLFDIGCDDYVTKPFYIEELLARVKRNIRKSSQHSLAKKEIHEDFVFGNIKIDFGESSLYKNGVKIDLTRKIFDILSFFVYNRNQVISKEQLINRFWNDSDIYPENTLAVHIHKIRAIIEEKPSSPEYLKTRRGIGYVFEG